MKFMPFKNRARVKQLTGQVQALEEVNAKLQAATDILINAGEKSVTYTGQPYRNYEDQVKAISDKMMGCAAWGNVLTQNIVELRACFAIGAGPQPILIGEGKSDPDRHRPALDFCKSMLRLNDVDEDKSGAWATEAEIEGKALFVLLPDKENKSFKIRLVPWTTFRYTVEADPKDYDQFVRARYRRTTTSTEDKEIVFPEEEFVYIRLCGRLAGSINETPPKIAKVLAQIENLDKALYDWRTMNNLFASPTPYFKVAEPTQAEKLYNRLKKINWKIGKLVVTSADYDLVGISDRGIETLEKEITFDVKIISGSTGTPVHFLGFPDLMSNRATAENLMELLTTSMNKERKIWKAGYRNLLRKALAKSNVDYNTSFDPNVIGVDIPEISSTKLRELSEVWLPIRESGQITRETFLSKVPELDVPMENRTLDNEDEERARQMIQTISQQNEDEDE